MKNTNEFGARLKNIRQQRNLSQEELAFQCNMQASHIGQIERGQKNPTLDTLIKISNGLDMPLTELLDFETSIQNQEKLKNIKQINAYLTILTPKQQEHILAIVKTFIEYG
ncbi:MAG: helix-turn-helix transcriptional regulator [Acutalibacteraceae bacterium]|nr:helix-turn-helix transcriptional regulator [Acutalibacteraceae bacterium]